MVIETFKPGRTDAVYERFARQGRMLPEGLRYLASWLTTDRRRCFQLMESDRPELFAIWVDRWRDLVDFEIIPVEASPAGEGPTAQEKERAVLPDGHQGE
jgi:hypothetical protein